MRNIIRKAGVPFTLPDGRTLKFVELDISALDNPCYGCVFDYNDCTPLSEYIGHCGNGRSDGLSGIFIEIKQ